MVAEPSVAGLGSIIAQEPSIKLSGLTQTTYTGTVQPFSRFPKGSQEEVFRRFLTKEPFMRLLYESEMANVESCPGYAARRGRERSIAQPQLIQVLQAQIWGRLPSLVDTK
eukprot:1487580-Amphidinium_carterae.1